MSIYDEPKRLARELREKYFDNDCSPREAFPKIFKAYNIEVQYAEFGENLRHDPETNMMIITLPRNTSAERDNYTIAHEIGHIVLKHPLNEEGMIYRSGEITPHERQANVFAAELLMPEALFRKECARLDNDMYAVAARFEVSPAAAGVRMSILNIA